jgi:hypothetical protein
MLASVAAGFNLLPRAVPTPVPSASDGFVTEFAQTNKGYGGLYVGTQGNLVLKTIDNSIITLVSASGFINGLVAAVSASSTATNIVGFDPIVSSVYVPAAPTTTTAAPTTTTTVAP